MLTKTPLEIEKAAQSASIRIINSGDDIIIKQVFDIKNKSNIGVLILLLGSVFLIYTGIIGTGELMIKLAWMGLSLFMLVVSLLLLIVQFIDKVTLYRKGLTVINKLKKTTLPYSIDMIAAMKMEEVEVKGRYTTSLFCVVKLYLITQGEEVQIFTFQTPIAQKQEAIALGEYLTKIINDRMVAVKQSITILPT